MVGFKQIIYALLLTMVTGVAIAQNNTNSPYTRYGYGDLAGQYFGNSKAMGGVAFGLRDGSQINPLNPASYTAIDTLTFLFEGGVTLQNMNISDNGIKMNAKNSSFDYLALQFRLRPWMAMSIGMLPYSNVGYSLTQSHTSTDDTPSYTKSLGGEGGLHQLYAGLGVKVMKSLSLGVNVSYFWGDITRSLAMIYPNTSSSYSYFETTGISVSDYKLDFGVQYTKEFSKKHSATIGAVFSPKKSLHNDTYFQTTLQNISSSSDVSTNTRNLDVSFELPNSFGLGITYNYDKRLTVGADYSLQKWSKVKYMGETGKFSDYSKISVGAEYIPNLTGRSYLSHVKYRLGGYYSTPYYAIDGKRATREYGVTGGFGLPLPRSRSILSISGQFVRTKGLETNMVNENIFRLSIGFTFNERWFFKSRVE